MSDDKIDDGGPAFPDPTFPRSGMSLRDWFAGMAAQGSFEHTNPSKVAIWAYGVADAMIAARKATK